jgi:PelA/Pel-15E family pectate lyase
VIALLMISLFIFPVDAQDAPQKYPPIDVRPFSDSNNHWLQNHGRDRNDPRFEPEQIIEIADNIIQYQNLDGGWPKNLDWLGDIDYEVVKQVAGSGLKRSTFDNRNTYTQTEYLAKAYAATGFDRFKTAADRGLGYIILQQRASGGWRGSDVDGITFNDDVMTGIMNLLLDIRLGAYHFAWLATEKRKALDQSLERAIQATLNCQIVIDSTYTAWCQQHDHSTFAPIKARSYELPSITPAESTAVVRFLMRLPNPSPELQTRIRSAVEWMKKSAIHGIRLETKKIQPIREKYHTITEDRFIIHDPDARPIWTRYYEMDTNRPFFCNRDGIKVFTLAEVKIERRTGYAWYGHWPSTLINKDFPQWQASLK